MGAWGTGIFEDDQACDLVHEIMEKEAVAFIQAAIPHKDLDELEYEEGMELIVSGAVLDMILNGTKYDYNPDGFDDWLAKQEKSSVEAFKPDIVAGLQVVLSDKSELQELWQENEEDYPAWRSSIEAVITALS